MDVSGNTHRVNIHCHAIPLTLSPLYTIDSDKGTSILHRDTWRSSAHRTSIIEGLLCSEAIVSHRFCFHLTLSVRIRALPLNFHTSPRSLSRLDQPSDRYHGLRDLYLKHHVSIVACLVKQHQVLQRPPRTSLWRRRQIPSLRQAMRPSALEERLLAIQHVRR